MKAQERHHLKTNEFVTTVAGATVWYRGHQSRVMGAIVALVVVVAAGGGYAWWTSSNQERAGALLGVAMTIYQAPVIPPSNVPGATQQPGSYPSEKARYDAALKAFEDVATQYASSEAGLAARYHAAETLVSLGRAADARTAYEDVIARAGKSIYVPMAELGLANALLAAGQSDVAVQKLEALAAIRDGALPVDGVLMQLAGAYQKLGKKAEARTTFKRVVDEFPDSPYVQSARQQMALLG